MDIKHHLINEITIHDLKTVQIEGDFHNTREYLKKYFLQNTYLMLEVLHLRMPSFSTFINVVLEVLASKVNY